MNSRNPYCIVNDYLIEAAQILAGDLVSYPRRPLQDFDASLAGDWEDRFALEYAAASFTSRNHRQARRTAARGHCISSKPAIDNPNCSRSTSSAAVLAFIAE